MPKKRLQKLCDKITFAKSKVIGKVKPDDLRSETNEFSLEEISAIEENYNSESSYLEERSSISKKKTTKKSVRNLSLPKNVSQEAEKVLKELT